jgi:hypothetical protein
MIRSLQTKIWYADDIIPYDQLITTSYPVQVIQGDQLIGLKISLADHVRMPAAERIVRLEQILPNILAGTRCMLRETPITAPFGYYLLTMPVPKDQLRGIINEVIRVLTILERDFGITVTKEYEINVSGQCSPMETEYKLARFDVPSEYIGMLVHQPGSPYSIGYVERINEGYITVRTLWSYPVNTNIISDLEHIKMLAYLIAGIF